MRARITLLGLLVVLLVVGCAPIDPRTQRSNT